MKQMGILRNSSRLIRENISCYTHLIFTINQDYVDVNKVIIKIKKAKTALQLCGISCHHSILLFMVEFSGCHKMLYINCVTYYCSFQITCILYTCFYYCFSIITAFLYSLNKIYGCLDRGSRKMADNSGVDEVGNK